MRWKMPLHCDPEEPHMSKLREAENLAEGDQEGAARVKGEKMVKSYKEKRVPKKRNR